MREIGETNEQNRQKRYASIMEMKLYHKWELNEMGGLGLYSEDWFSSQEGVFRG
jgi:hypothetical protein